MGATAKGRGRRYIAPRPGEFEIEGTLDLAMVEGYLIPFVDGIALSTYIVGRLRTRPTKRGNVKLGRCKVLIIPVRE